MDSININTFTEHMDVTFGRQTEGYVHLFIPELNNLTLWHHVLEREAIYADIELYAKDYDVYIGAHLGKEAKLGKQRNKRIDVKSINCIFFEADLFDEQAHKKTALSNSKEEYLDFFKETPFYGKTHFNTSGHGLHGVIQLDEPLFITDEKSLKRAENLSQGIGNYIRLLAKKKRGWNDDNVSDLPRLMRPLGSFNHKKGEKKPVKVLARTTYRFSIEELEALIPSEAEEKKPSRNLLKEWHKTKSNPDKKGELRPIAQGCSFVRHGIENSKTLSEPHWHALISLVARCENGKELAHDVSENYPKYSQTETAKKVDAVIASETGPVTCKYIRDQLLFPACRTCPLSASKMKSPISLGFVDGYLAGLFSQFVYDLKTKRFYEINPPKEALQ